MADEIKKEEIVDPETEELNKKIMKMEQLAEKLKAENDRSEILNRQKEILISKQILGGRTEAGTTENKPKELTPEEYAKRVMSGKL